MKKNCYLTNTLMFKFLLLVSLTGGAQTQTLTEYMRANLYVLQNGSPVLIDGNLTHYHSTNSNNVDFYDAWKMTNPGENFGIIREGVTLAVERRKIFTMTDTTYFRMWNLRQQSYFIEFISSNLNHPNVSGFVVDKYLDRRYPVNCNGTTRVSFNITSDPRSADQTRFKVIYRFNNPSVPVKNITLRLLPQTGNSTRIDWDITRELYMESYEVQKSPNGIDFESIDLIVPQNEGIDMTYSFLDKNCLDETYYRIKGTVMSGEIIYSGIVRMKPVAPVNEIAVYPNPVINKEAQIYMNEPQTGLYRIMLIGAGGDIRMRTAIQVKEGQSLNKVNLPSGTNPGIYLLQIISPDNKRVTKTISVL